MMLAGKKVSVLVIFSQDHTQISPTLQSYKNRFECIEAILDLLGQPQVSFVFIRFFGLLKMRDR